VTVDFAQLSKPPADIGEAGPRRPMRIYAMLHPMSRPPENPTAMRPGLEHVRAPQPIFFPVEEELPESKQHLEVRTFLYELLKFWQ
jgi:hypothetical protein